MNRLRNKSNLRFVVVCAILFLAGSALRVAAGVVTLPWSQASPAAAPGARVNRALPAEAVELVLSFYEAVDKGRYAEAYGASLENHWQTADTVQVDRLTQEDEFVAALSDELGANGMSLNIVALQALTHTVVLRQELDPARYPELSTLDLLPAGNQVRQLGQVELAGTLLGRCSRWDWTRDVLVAELPGQGWRVLLPGVRKAHGLHNVDWFLPHE
jgi:hypothetical protein